METGRKGAQLRDAETTANGNSRGYFESWFADHPVFRFLPRL